MSSSAKATGMGATERLWLVQLDDDANDARAMRLAIDAPIHVGRGPQNHVVLDDARVSRLHARIAPEHDGCVVCDLKSANGTFVNGVAVERHLLAPEDVIALGPYTFRVERAAPGTSAETPRPVEPETTRSLTGLSPLVARAAAAAAAASRPNEQARLRHDLANAAEIQKSFLPREVVAVEGLDLFAEYRAAYGVGGDFYDVFWVGRGRLAVFIGDISGKGISGALLMARISTELRIAALAEVDPVAVLTTMNRATLARGQPELFFTAVYLTLDVKSGEVVLANAGHPTPYRRHADGRVQAITAGRGCAVGILDDPGFTATSFRLEYDDALVLYTDGVIEAADAHGDLYGAERLEACLASAGVDDEGTTRPNLVAEEILRSVERYTQRGSVGDDLTLFICQRSAATTSTMQPRRRSSSFPAPHVATAAEPTSLR